MKKMCRLLVVLSLIFVPFVSAKEINHSHVKVDSSIDFNDNVYGTSIIAGEDITSTGQVQGANLMAANKIDYKGQSDYYAALGNTINIDGTILYDSFIAGNIINIKKNAFLQRDVMIAGSDIEIKGSIGRNVTIYGGKVVISSAVIGGNVKIYAENIKITDEANIFGQVSYPKDAKVSISSNITNIKKTSAIKTDESDVLMKFVVNRIWSFMGLVVVFAFISLLVPKIFNKIQSLYKKVDFNKATETFSKGLVFIIIVPVFALFALLVPFGTPLSLITISLYLISLYVSKIFTGYLLGYKLWEKYMKKDINMLLVGILGLFVLFVLDFIPFVRGIVTLISVLCGVGIIVEYL